MIMSTDKIIRQLLSIKDNAESFTTKDGDDEIWREDIAVCEELISILSEAQDAGINNTDQIRKMIDAVRSGKNESSFRRS